jgi:proteasome component ECM29
MKYVIGNYILPFNPTTYNQVLIYLRNCLAYEAGVACPHPNTLSDLYDEAPKIASFLTENYKNPNKGPLASYVGMVRQALSAVNSK